jgi:hypothetical protein
MDKPSLHGQEYRTASTLYSVDGKRAAAVLEFRSGETYLDEQEWVEGTTFKNRHSGDLGWPVCFARRRRKIHSSDVLVSR